MKDTSALAALSRALASGCCTRRGCSDCRHRDSGVIYPSYFFIFVPGLKRGTTELNPRPLPRPIVFNKRRAAQTPGRVSKLPALPAQTRAFASQGGEGCRALVLNSFTYCGPEPCGAGHRRPVRGDCHTGEALSHPWGLRCERLIVALTKGLGRPWRRAPQGFPGSLTPRAEVGVLRHGPCVSPAPGEAPGMGNTCD